MNIPVRNEPAQPKQTIGFGLPQEQPKPTILLPLERRTRTPPPGGRGVVENDQHTA